MASPNLELRGRIRSEILRQWQESANTSGPRPTIDSVHAVLGGSKLTIGKVLTEVRDEAFSAMLRTAKIASIPDEHQQVLQQFYAQVVERVEADADARRADERQVDEEKVRQAQQALLDAEQARRIAGEHNTELLRQLDTKEAELTELRGRLEAAASASDVQREVQLEADRRYAESLAAQRTAHELRARELSDQVTALNATIDVQAAQLLEREAAAVAVAERQQAFESSLLSRVADAESATAVARTAASDASAQVLRQHTQLIEAESALAVARSQLLTTKGELADANARAKQLSNLAASQSNELASLRTEVEILRRPAAAPAKPARRPRPSKP